MKEITILNASKTLFAVVGHRDVTLALVAQSLNYLPKSD